MGLLAGMVVLVCIYAPVLTVCGAEACSGFRHLENGRTFFRYGGLLVTFRCQPGYNLHGHKTNSCVSGHWSRDLPVCVGSGCSNPGPLTDGTSSMNEDGSWVVFICDSGFQLHGPSMLYCRGHTWNSTKPVCKESDMMRSISGVSVQKPNIHQNLQDAVVLKTEQQSDHNTLTNTVSKEANLNAGLLSHRPSRMSSSERTKVSNPKVHLQQHIHFPNLKIKEQTTHKARLQKASEGPETETVRHSSREGTEKVDKVTLMFASKAPVSTTVSSTLSIMSGTEKSTASLHPFSTAHSPTITAVTKTYPHLPWTQEPTETLISLTLSTSSSSSAPASSPLSLSSPLANFSALASSSPSSSMKTQLSHVTPPSNTTSVPPLLSRSLLRRPVCLYPPVPTHGTFYFRNVENPGPREYRHYIQYTCYPGYTLAHGDIHSYCQQDGTWSGVTPVCLELTPCSVNNGGCSQLCSHTPHFYQSSSQTETRTQCYCRPGFVLLDDGRMCRDVDECVEGQHKCQHRCINTFGSFKCDCDDGYQPAQDQASCTDVDECLLPVAVTGCVFGCVNTPGSFHCQCPAGYSLHSADGHCQDIDECAVNQGLGPCMEHCHNSPGSYRCSCMYGHILAGDGHSCIAECPPGYRKQPAPPPENSTAQVLTEECVDINECQEVSCEWQCVNLPGSHRCICPRGYTLHKDARRCQDINECSQKNGGCSHLCINQKGGYKCACPASHRLSSYSWKKCLPRATANTAG